MKWLKTLSGRFSKTKIASIVTAVLGAIVSTGVIDLSMEQVAGIGGIVAGILGLFLRDGIDEGATKEVDKAAPSDEKTLAG